MTPPEVTCPANIQTTVPNGQTNTNVNYIAEATATDNVDATVPIAYSPPSGSFFNTGVTTVTARATDSAGNIGECTFTVNAQGK